ncbi:MAG: magnesium transporter MgtE N-terminal domain-containing protein [Longimicrobiales bacterium]
MKLIIALSVGTLLGAGALGVMSGLKAKDELLTARLQATEDSIAAVAMANSEAALADSLGGELPPSGELGESTTGVDGEATSDVDQRTGQSNTTSPTESPEVDEAAAEAAAQAAAEAQAAEEEARALAKETGERLSKIFSEMKPAEAADVLTHLSDGEIERILLGIRERDAAAILAQLDPERAAAVSRRVLRPGADAQ